MKIQFWSPPNLFSSDRYSIKLHFVIGGLYNREIQQLNMERVKSKRTKNLLNLNFV